MGKTIAAIKGIGGFVPKDVLTNEDLAKMVDTSDEWITTRTGIKERHIYKEPNKATSDMGVEVMHDLMNKTGLKPEEIDLLIVGTVTADMIFPDTANTILDKIGAKNAFGFDINAACSGFLYALTTGAKFIESNTYKNVVVMGVDMMSSIIDYTDRATCVIFGDGGGAVLLQPSEDSNGIQDSILKSDGSGRAYLHMKAGGSLKPPTIETVMAKEHYVFQDGKPVFKAAVNGMIDTVTEVLKRNEMTPEDIDWVIPHQANLRIISAVSEGLGIEKEKVIINIHKYGNTTAGTLPLCMWDYENQFKKGDKIILTAFGGGFTWGSTLLTWAYDSN